MKNSLTDLNDHLFSQLERLGSENLSPESLAIELDRTKAITDIGRTIISNAQLALDARKALDDGKVHKLPSILDTPKTLGLAQK